jgi:hypothetical protein
MHHDDLIDLAPLRHPAPAANTSTKTIDCLQWKSERLRAHQLIDAT